MPLVPAPCCILVCLVGLTTMELVTFMDGVQKWAWYLGGASFVALRLTSLLLTSHNSDSQSVNKPSYFFCSQICIFLQKKKCRDALNKLCTYYCHGPPPPGGAGAGDLSTTLTAECFWGGGIGDLNLLSAHANCGSYLVQQTDVQRQHGRVQTAR